MSMGSFLHNLARKLYGKSNINNQNQTNVPLNAATPEIYSNPHKLFA
jgi:hypothetical protein